MKKAFPLYLLIPKQETKEDTCANPSSVAPVVDPWHQEAEEKNPQGPGTGLSINGSPINSSPAFAIIEGGANQARYRGRGSDGKFYAGQIRDPEANHTTQGIEDKPSINSVFPEDKGDYLPEGNHIEQDVEDATMKVIGGDKGPPPMQTVNRNGSGRAQKQKALTSRGEEGEWI